MAYVGPVEGHVASGVDIEHAWRTIFTALVASNIGTGDVHHGTIARNLANDSTWNGIRVPVWVQSRICCIRWTQFQEFRKGVTLTGR